jgi:Flagellar hook-length control protein FliK
VLALLQEAQQQIPRAAGYAPLTRVLMLDGRGEDVVVRTNTPPPPFRGGQPSAQAIASPSLAPNASLSAVAHRLLDETDAALSRQTLLQVASLPDRTDSSGNRVDPSLPRWHFEVPFATPQGTAMAQFEISRDANGSPADPAKRIWRARFSLDVEPAGPVHALVALIGDRTSVRMWAERPATAAQLRAGLGDLSQALNRAELSPGDLTVQEGTPPAVAPPKAGHFLDRAL